MPELDFNFYVGGLEDAILAVLTEPMKTAGAIGFELYSGELDNKDEIKTAFASKANNYPLVMISYANGVNVPDPGVAMVGGLPIPFRHICNFTVIVADRNPQGNNQQRRSAAYPMLAAAHMTLTGQRLTTMVDGEPVALNTDPLVPTDVIYIRGVPNIAVYALMIETAFRWISPDRSTDGTDVGEVIVGVRDTLEADVVVEGLSANEIEGANLPGVLAIED